MRDPGFRLLWAALTASLLGTQITGLALPVLAAVSLDASPLQMGGLAAAGQLPYLVVSLPAGVLVDRVRRRPLLVATDAGSAVLLLSLPIAAAAGSVTLVHLCLVAAGLGTFAVVGELAHYAYTPSLVGPAGLVGANSRFQASHSTAAAAGPGVAGGLIQLVTAPFAVLVDAASFLASAVLVSMIRRPEPPRGRPTVRVPFQTQVAEGLRHLLGHPLLRPIMLAGSAANAFMQGSVALFVLYATQELDLAPAVLGAVFGVGGAFAVAGAGLAPVAARAFGTGPSIIGGWVLASAAALLVPAAAGPPAVVVAVLMCSHALTGLGDSVANIHQWTLRQAVTPEGLQGRVTAGHRFLTYGAGAFGAFGGGALGSAVGVRAALVVCTAGALACFVTLAVSPLRRFLSADPYNVQS